MSKLTAKQSESILSSNRSDIELATIFGVSRRRVSKIRKYYGENHSIRGSLTGRMTEFLSSLFGKSLSELGPMSTTGKHTLRYRVYVGVIMEFGLDAEVFFPDERTVRLQCGNTVAEISP